MTNNGLAPYSSDYLGIIEDLAYNLIAPEEIAQILEFESSWFLGQLSDEASEVYKSFYKGLLRKEVEIKQSSSLPVDVDTEEFRLRQLRDFKSRIIIQLDG